MSTVEVCLVRHAESVSNAKGIWQGHGDSPLNDRGKAQVEALRAVVEHEDYDLRISSDLARAATTAKALGRPVEPDPAWREIDVGAWEGLTMAEVGERFPEQIAALQERRPIAVGGGESWLDVFARVDRGIASIRERLGGGGRAVVFTHGGIIAALLAGLLGARDRSPWPLGRIRNTARTILRFGRDGVELVAHNDDTHLPEELRNRHDPRDDQIVLHLTPTEAPAADHSPVDRLEASIDHGRATRLGGVMPLSMPVAHIADVAHHISKPAGSSFRFAPHDAGRTTSVLIGEDYRIILDYGIGSLQI